MSGRLTSRALPSPPTDWTPSSKEAWNKLIQVLEASPLFDQGRRTRQQFVVPVTVSAPTTLSTGMTLAQLNAAFIVLVKALQRSPYLDVREI